MRKIVLILIADRAVINVKPLEQCPSKANHWRAQKGLHRDNSHKINICYNFFKTTLRGLVEPWTGQGRALAGGRECPASSPSARPTASTANLLVIKKTWNYLGSATTQMAMGTITKLWWQYMEKLILLQEWSWIWLTSKSIWRRQLWSPLIIRIWI